MKFKKFFSTLLSALTIFSVSSFSGIFANEIDDAELLYTRMTEFLGKNNDVTPEKIDDVCKEIIGNKIPESNLLSKFSGKVCWKYCFVSWSDNQRIR